MATRCTHSGCTCKIEADRKYCSEHCARSSPAPGVTEAGGCGCGHPGCGAKR